MNTKKTSKKIGTLASKKLKDKNSSKSMKEQAGSALSQMSKNKETSQKVAKNASEILKKENESKSKKKLSGSNLSQSKGKKKK